MSRWRGRGWLVPLCMVVALVLGVVPLPSALQLLRPFWLGLIVAWMVIELPGRMGIGRAFALGLVADMLYGSLLGEHALRLVLLTFVLQHFRARMRFFPLLQQAIVVGLLLFADRCLVALLHLLLGHNLQPLAWWLAPLVGVVLWPLMFVLLDRLGQGRRGR